MDASIDKLLGKRVRAKRFGWNEPESGLTVNGDLLDPPGWRDDGLPEDIEGVLGVFNFKGNAWTVPYRDYFVGNESVDPETVVPFQESGA